MKTITRLFPICVFGLLAVACASVPEFKTEGVDLSLKPATAAGRTGDKVIWGGSIIDITNLPDKTRIEVLAYPLDNDFRPIKGKNTQGRFLVEKPGYLEPKDYRPGKDITVVGTLGKSQTGKIGEATYHYPVVQATRVELWQPKSQSNIQFGIGIGIHN